MHETLYTEQKGNDGSNNEAFSSQGFKTYKWHSKTWHVEARNVCHNPMYLHFWL